VASEFLVKRLLMQASMTVLAGLLVSSAALAEDTQPGEPEISICGFEEGPGPDVTIDPVDSIDEHEADCADCEVMVDPIDPQIDVVIDDTPVEAMQSGPPDLNGAGPAPNERNDNAAMNGRDRDIPGLRHLAVN
jgi:hypothetical protein